MSRRSPDDSNLIFRRELLDAAGMARALRRIAHEIVERNGGVGRLMLVGIRSGGVPIAERIARYIVEAEGLPAPVPAPATATAPAALDPAIASAAPSGPVTLGAIDITLYRDDVFEGLPKPEIGRTELPVSLAGSKVVLVDDVLYTGRTVRAALDVLMDFGRPRAVELAVLVDRGLRELPIHADYAGLVVPTTRSESVRVELAELDGVDRVILRAPRAARAGSRLRRRSDGNDGNAGYNGNDGALRVSAFRHRHVLGLEGWTREDMLQVLDLTETFLELNARPIKKAPTLRGRTVINLFLEPSTRTRTSFEIAAKRLSADAVNISGATSSTVKGETLLDTARNLQAMAPDVIVLRHGASGGPHYIARHVAAAVINAGDGLHEHPSQGLLDAAVIRKHLRPGARDLDGLVVAIVGDIAHSRVARSNLIGLGLLGAKVRVAAPRTMLPLDIDQLGAEVYDRVEPALLDGGGADVVMMLRIQKERMSGPPLFPSTREYSIHFGLGPRLAERLKPGAIILHPGPINRGVELDPAVADGPRSVILDQVTHGVAVRMALLYLVGGGALGDERA